MSLQAGFGGAIVLATVVFVVGVSSEVAAQQGDAQRLQSLERQLGELQERVRKLEEELSQGVPVNFARSVEPVAGGWRVASNWQLLIKGQTEAEVEEILGAPDARKGISKFEFWDYGDGQAKFYQRRLKSWEMPDSLAK